MSEVIKPRLKDIEAIYHSEFKGMTIDEVSLASLLETRNEMITKLHSALTENDKKFLLAVKHGNADWGSFALPEVQHLPAIQWKLHNLAQMQIQKRKIALEALEHALYGQS